MKVVAREIDRCEFDVLDDDACLVGVGIYLGAHVEAVFVVVAAISWTMTWWLIKGLPRQF